MKTFETTIYYHEVELEVKYEFIPAEESTYDFQGCDAEAIIIEVNVESRDIIRILTEDQLEDIEYLIICEHYNS